MGIMVPDLEIPSVGYVCAHAYVAISREPMGLYRTEDNTGWRVCTAYGVWVSHASRLAGKQPVMRSSLEFWWVPTAGEDTTTALYDAAYGHIKALYPTYEEDHV